MRLTLPGARNTRAAPPYRAVKVSASRLLIEISGWRRVIVSWPKGQAFGQFQAVWGRARRYFLADLRIQLCCGSFAARQDHHRQSEYQKRNAPFQIDVDVQRPRIDCFVSERPECGQNDSKKSEQPADRQSNVESQVR